MCREVGVEKVGKHKASVKKIFSLSPITLVKLTTVCQSGLAWQDCVQGGRIHSRKCKFVFHSYPILIMWSRLELSFTYCCQLFETSLNLLSVSQIFESFLTIFITRIKVCGSFGYSKYWLKLKIEPPWANLACLNWWNTL
jgi:hypothetical protein